VFTWLRRELRLLIEVPEVEEYAEMSVLQDQTRFSESTRPGRFESATWSSLEFLLSVECPETEESVEISVLLVGLGELIRLGGIDSALESELRRLGEFMRLRTGEAELDREREPSS
jgi:hypothetical protein